GLWVWHRSNDRSGSLSPAVRGILGLGAACASRRLNHPLCLAAYSLESKMARTCAFCAQGGKQSREHVLAKWLAREFPTGGRLTTLQEKGPSGVIVREHPAAMLIVRVKQVCSRCNQTWMSAIEHAAKPILLPMMNGKVTE